MEVFVAQPNSVNLLEIPGKYTITIITAELYYGFNTIVPVFLAQLAPTNVFCSFIFSA